MPFRLIPKLLSVLATGSREAIGHGRDLPTAEVLYDQTFQHVVDLVRMETELELCAVVYGTVMLKIPYVAGIEHDLREGKRRPFLCQGRPGEQQERGSAALRGRDRSESTACA